MSEAQKMVYYDNTRLSSYKECPRAYFFRHVRHWRGKEIPKPLIFGLSWHESMDVVWGLLGKTEDEKVLALAMEAFNKEWIKDGGIPEDEMNDETRAAWLPRLTSVAAEMLWNYILKNGDFIKEVEIINIERPFAVPINPNNPNIFYIGRLDKEFRKGGRVYLIEHKTTTAYSKEYGFLTSYTTSWSPNSQIDGYLHSGYMTYGAELKSVYVDAVLVHKQHHAIHKFIPIERHLAALDDWRDATEEWIDRIEIDKKRFKDGDRRAFPMNTNSCHGKYGPCSYINICKFVPNLMQKVEPPEGFIVERWSPFETLGLEKIGLPPEEE